MAEFHFLRPLWLLLIPVGLLLAWALLRSRARGGSWGRLVEPALQKYVLVRSEVLKERRWPLLAVIAATIVASVALAGPTWERLPVPVYRSDDALVVALDLSRSMDATDVEPSRLARAKLKLLALLERRSGGEMALVVFSAHAFTVTPLTTDNRTIAALVGSLYTSIMPSQGSFPEAGLEKSAQLLRQAGIPGGEILLITDATIGEEALALVRRLRDEGIRLSVLAVGTEEGAPIPDAAGGFVTDRAGQVVVPTLNLASLRRLAQIGGGRFAQLAPDERDLAALFPETLGGASVTEDVEADVEADIWRDQGAWLAVLLLPFAALAFRRGWIVVWVAAIGLAGLPTEPALAFEWMDLWKRPDRRGLEALERNEAQRAAELFEDPSWRGVAQYRAEEYAASADTLVSDTTALGLYNRGNALARAGRLEEAIDAYGQVLELEPDHEDARYNRELLEELLEQNNDDQSEEQQQNAQSNSGEESADAAESGEQPDGSDTDQSQASSNSNESTDPSDQQASDASSDASDDRGDEPDQESVADAEDESERQPPPQARALPDDIEQWASDQAADQWLRRVPQDPGGLLRRKFLYQYQRLGVDQDGNYVWPGDETEPW